LMLYREGRFKEALPHLAFSVEHLTQVPNGMRFTLASTYWLLDMYIECIHALEPLLQMPLLGEKMDKEVRKMHRDAHFCISNPKDTSLELPAISLGEAINTEWPEYLPAVTADEKTLIFTRRFRGKEDFFTSSKQDDGTWSTARPMNELNRAENEGAICIAADGKTIIYTICNDPNGYGNCDLYISEKVLNRWSPARNLGGTINTKYKETQPSLSPDGQSLYFVSDRPGGFGGLDIYVSQKDKRGNWQEPINLGTTINTSRDDLTPYLHFDHQTFYFASEGHPGYGGMDIFMSKIDHEGAWSNPQNLGHPYNSKGDDSCPVVLMSGDKAYLSKEDPLERDLRTMNLYEVTLQKNIAALPTTFVQFLIQDQITHKPLKSVVELFDLSTGRRLLIQQADRDGNVLATMPMNTQYAVRIFHPGYIPLSQTFDLMMSDSNFTTPTTLLLKQTPVAALASDPIKKDTFFTLNNIYFESGSANLNETSAFELQSLVSWLKENPRLSIEISGHTDNVGNANENLKLSQNRAEAVVRQLIQDGIQADRLTAKGYGDTLPIADNKTPEGRSQNRRTAFKILQVSSE
jgi:outer membrane protein OmpA-like peptidoglycan-associated protein